jgi:hypothetical protein
VNAISKQVRMVDHIRSLDIDHVAKLRHEFALAVPELPRSKRFYVELSEDEHTNLWSQRILNEVTIVTNVHLL